MALIVYLLDTNVISELLRPRPNAGLVAWIESLESITLSAITVEELVFGVERAKGKERARLRQWLAALLALPPRIVPVDERVARVAGELRATREATGRRVAHADMLIAASALCEGLVLATRNVRDFAACGVALLDPFHLG